MERLLPRIREIADNIQRTEGKRKQLAGFLRELVLRSSLIIGLYASADAPLCEEHDHCAIVDAIDGGDEAGASDLIDAHLRHIETSVQFEKDSKPEDLHAILAVH